MKQLVGNVTDVNRAIDRVLRIFVWALPALAITYGVIILLGFVPGVPYTSVSVFYLISTVLISLAIVQLKLPGSRTRGVATYLLAYHLCVGVGMFFVYGMNTPMVLVWGILSLITVIYFGIGTSLLSLGALAGVFLLYSNTIGFKESWFPINLITCFIFLAAIVIIYAYLQEETYRKQEKLVEARNEERVQRQALLTTINSTSQAMFTLSAKGRVLLYNSAFLALLDTNKSLEQAHISKIMPLEYEGGKKFDYAKALSQKFQFSSDELIFPLSDNDHLNIRLDINRVFNESNQDNARLQHFVCTARDITKEKSLEEERNEFISVVSHELRTPIAITEAAIDNARYAQTNAIKDKKLIQKSLDIAYNKTKFLANLVNDLSTLSRAERGVGEDKELIDVNDFIHDIYNEYISPAKDKGLQLDLSIPDKIGNLHVSRLYLHELIQNFITNAIKYTKKGNVVIEVTKESNNVTFSIIDSGIGISKADQARIFEKFYRSEDYRTRETGGTGLGLHVSRKLSKKLGTQIKVESKINHGSKFSITLTLDSGKS